MPYIHFTEKQKQRANSMDLEEFLLQSGERLLPSGREKRMASDHSVTICGSEWYDHAVQRGGGPVAFLQHFHHLSYPEAVQCLLRGDCESARREIERTKKSESKEFTLPPAADHMRRIFAYLIRIRRISREVLIPFVQQKLIYEDTPCHNAVFVGRDDRGIPRHAHRRSTASCGRGFRQTVEGSDFRWAFHWTGRDRRLFVFESPIDLLSYITLHPENWRDHSYVACCGTAWLPVAGMMGRMPGLRELCLCMDNDDAGRAACDRLEAPAARVGLVVYRDLPRYKDWNEDLQKLAEKKQNLPLDNTGNPVL